MTDISIKPEDPRSADATALLNASHSLMQSLFPRDSCHYLSIDDLCKPNIHLFVARHAGTAAGCGALALYDGYGEIKSMFTADAFRGQGVADRLLSHIQATAIDHGLPLLRLETGDTLGAAQRLYARHGFQFRGPFADYSEQPRSLFMEKAL
ncbi:MAG: GNAT family N-acetyltransferase [Paracoccaceae bacterium]